MRKFLSEECGLIFTDSQNIEHVICTFRKHDRHLSDIAKQN